VEGLPQAELTGRVKTEDINQFYVKNNDGI
jgi:hypothetical protein